MQIVQHILIAILVFIQCQAYQCAVIIEDDNVNGNDNDNPPEVHGDEFYYFGYGSNMLSKRIHIQNPTAVKIAPGLLMDYRLDFNTYSKSWDGAPATIVPTDNATVWGTLWKIKLSNMPNLDSQEGVDDFIYEPISVPVFITTGDSVMARAYVLLKQPQTDLSAFTYDNIPLERQPSKTYLQCLVKGAIETGISPDYVEWLKSLKHNGKVSTDFEELLELQNVDLKY